MSLFWKKQMAKTYKWRRQRVFFIESHGNELYFPAFTATFPGNDNPDVVLSTPRMYFLVGLHAPI